MKSAVDDFGAAMVVAASSPVVPALDDDGASSTGRARRTVAAVTRCDVEPRPVRPTVRQRICALVIATSVCAAGCASTGLEPVDADDYRSQLVAGCTTAQTAQQSLEEPGDPTEVSVFATNVAQILTTQADSARALRVPEELDDDHRAFVQNTADQAARWRELAATPTTDTDRFGSLQRQILELTLGRDDLALEMGVSACRVSA